MEDVELIHTIKEDKKLKEKEIRGIAILNDKLFVVRKNSSRFRVYDFKANDFHKCKFLTVKELVATLDLCSCKTTNCLYIMDEKTNPTPPEVLIINLEDKSVKHWTTKYEAIGNVSAAIDGNVIITDHDRQIILEYSNSGDVIHEISLQEFTNPWHAIKWDDGTYIVSHGDYFDPLHRVCLMKVKVEESVYEPKVEKEVGLHVEKSFGGQCGSAKDQLNMPTYFTSVSKKFVFVADLFNNRVLLLDSHLELQGQIVPRNKQKFLLPQTVALDEKRLVVVIHGVATEGDTLTNKDDCRIEEDCRILVFNIEPLLRSRNSNEPIVPSH